MFEVAHAGEVLVEAALVAGAEVALEIAGLIRHGIEDASAGVELADLRVDLLGRPLKEKLAEDTGGALFRRDRDAGACPGESAGADIDAEGERGEAGEGADALRDELVERDAVAEGAAGR